MSNSNNVGNVKVKVQTAIYMYTCLCFDCHVLLQGVSGRSFITEAHLINATVLAAVRTRGVANHIVDRLTQRGLLSQHTSGGIS